MKALLRNKNLWVIFFVLLVVVLVKLMVISYLGDIDWEPDSYAHFIELRTVYQNFPENLKLGLQVWSKPLYAYVLGLPVTLFNIQTLFGVQVINVFLIAGVSILIYLILRKFQIRFEFALFGLVLTNFSFLLFRSSITALTEPIFTLFLLGAFYAWQHGKFSLASLLIGIGVLGRIEGLLFVPIWLVLIYLKQKNYKKLFLFSIISLAPVAVWNFIGFLVSGQLLYLFSRGYPTRAGVYGFGNPISYIEGMLRNELLLTVLFVLSLGYLWQLARKRKYDLVAPGVIFTIFFVTQTFLWVFGLFGTAGLMRYFISVMPFLVISNTLFLAELFDKLNYKKMLGISMLAILVFFQFGYSVQQFYRGGMYMGLWNRPYLENGLRESGIWIKENIPSQTEVHVDRPEILYFAGRTYQNSSIQLPDKWVDGRSGVFVWTRDWGKSFGLDKDEMSKQAKLLATFDDYVWVFER